jgi:hypothetical protein
VVHRTVETGSGGAEWDVEHLRDLLHRQVAEIAQDDDCPVFHRQPPKASLQLVAVDATDEASDATGSHVAGISASGTQPGLRLTLS